MDDNILYPDTPFPLDKHLVLLGRRGSESHNLYIPSSDPNSIDDRDLMGVVIPPARYIIGLGQWEHAEAIKSEWDVVLYDWRKYIGLLSKSNPNVLSLIWLDPSDYLYIGKYGKLLIENRDLFKHKESAYNSFCGYAQSQLKKATAFKFEGYMGEKRKKLVERVGYDSKNAAHLIRLLHMGEEFQKTGELNVRRNWDRDMLLDIKLGKWSLQQVKEYAIKCQDKLLAAYKNSVLPEKLNLSKIEELVMDGYRSIL